MFKQAIKRALLEYAVFYALMIFINGAAWFICAVILIYEAFVHGGASVAYLAVTTCIFVISLALIAFAYYMIRLKERVTGVTIFKLR